MSQGGYIPLYRQILDWGWYLDTNTKVLFIHLLLKANINPGEWLGISIHPGQLITGRQKLSAETGLTEREIRTSLKKLEKTGEIEIKTTNKFSIITICKWGDYQIKNYMSDQQTTSKRPASDQQTTTIEERIEGNKKKSKEEREENFKGEVFSHQQKYDLNLLLKFIEYWTESSPGSSKLRFEKEPVFDIGRRLTTWAANEKKFREKIPAGPGSSYIHKESDFN